MKVLDIDHPENISFILGAISFAPNSNSEIFNDLLEKALSIMESPAGKDYLRLNFSTLSIYINMFRQRGQITYFKRLYHVMKDIFHENYKNMDISESLAFMMADFDFAEQNTEISNMIFQNIIKQVNNIELESIHEIFLTLGQLYLTDEQNDQMR